MPLKNKYLLIINPVSGTKKIKNIVNKICYCLDKYNIKPNIFLSKYKNHIKEHIKTLSSETFTDIIIWGGDGTFNEVINGLLNRNDKYLPTLGFLPGGTGNSVMHDLQGLTLDAAAHIIGKNNKKMIDVMEIKFSNMTEYSINIVGWGMVADIASLAEKLRWLGPIRYTLASIIYITISKGRDGTLTIDNIIDKNSFFFITISNTIFTGKGMKISPQAKLDDGLLDINIVKSNINKFKLAYLLPKLFTGQHITSKHVNYLQGQNINIDFYKKQKINIDGEIKKGSGIKIKILPQKLPIYY